MKGISKRSILGLLSENKAFSGANCPGIIFDDKNKNSISYLLGIMNSKLISYHLKRVCPSKLSGYTRFNANNINKVPVPIVDFNNQEDKHKHDLIASHVEQCYNSINSEIARTPQSKELIKRQIEATDKQIDALVYELYGLTDEEIKIVEEN